MHTPGTDVPSTCPQSSPSIKPKANKAAKYEKDSETKNNKNKATMRVLGGAIGLILSAIHPSEVVSFTPFSNGCTGVGRNSVQMASASATAETYTVTPIKSLDGTVTLPGSKSLSNRCLLLAALSEGNTKVDNLLESDDIRYMLEALDQMEVPVDRHSAESVTVTGQSGPINSPVGGETCELFLGNAGTAMRPLAAALCMGEGKFVLDGVPRMRERPIADLIDGLKQLGADVTCVEETGCPPVTINANGLKGGKVSFAFSNLSLNVFGRNSC